MLTSLKAAKYRIAALTGAVLLTAGIPLTFVNSVAHASSYSGYEWPIEEDNTQYFLNAWNGGPNVNVYNGWFAQNNYFDYAYNGNNIFLQFSGNPFAPYGEDCIGDLGNTSGNATAGLVPCPDPSIGYNGGWGTNFQTYACIDINGDQGLELHDNHWNAWVGPGGYSNGSHFYLNKPTPWCFTILPYGY